MKANEVSLYVIGSRNDSLTPIEAIEEEKTKIETYDVKDYYKFIFSDGNHREWKDNQSVIKDLLERI